MDPSSPEDQAVDRLVRQRLMDRTDGLSAAGVAAFVDGWSSALELVERTDLLLPGASVELHNAVRVVIERLRAAQRRTLEDEE